MARDAATRSISAIAEQCAASGLRLRDARAFFEAVYATSALHMTGGNQTRAAARAGVAREWFVRRPYRRLGERVDEGVDDG